MGRTTVSVVPRTGWTPSSEHLWKERYAYCPYRSASCYGYARAAGSPLVLVVDDNADIAESTATNLRRAGLRVRTALTADNALDCCKTQPFDATVLDHHPDDEYSETVLEEAPDMGLAVIVSDATPSRLADIQTRHAEKVFAVKTKPVAKSELVHVVQEAVTASRSQRKYVR